jgi:hypothetical protein
MSDIIITPESGLINFYYSDNNNPIATAVVSGENLVFLSQSGQIIVQDFKATGTIDVTLLNTINSLDSSGLILVEKDNIVQKIPANTLVATVGITGVVANEAVYINESGLLGTIYNTTIPDSTTNIAVGGASAGTAASVWKTRSVVEILDTILFPTINASISGNKSVDLTVSGGGGTLEVGTTTARVLTATFSPGSITNGNGTAGPALVGTATQYTFTGTGISSTSQASNILSLGTPAIVFGSNSWAVTVAHNAGTGDYYDNKGNIGTNLNASRVSGTTSDAASAPTIDGIYPYFWGLADSQLTLNQIISAIQAGSANKVLSSASGTITITFNATTAKFLWFAHDATYTTKSIWYVNALNTGSIGGSTNLFGSVQTGNVNSPTSLWSSRSFKAYITNYATTTGSDSMQLRNS